MQSDSDVVRTDGDLEPQRRWWEPPPLGQWSTQADFLLQCSDLAPGGMPADHPSKLAPLLAHPVNETIPYDVFHKEVEAAIVGTQAIKSGVAAAEPISCLRDPPHEPVPLVGSKARIGEWCSLSRSLQLELELVRDSYVWVSFGVHSNCNSQHPE